MRAMARFRFGAFACACMLVALTAGSALGADHYKCYASKPVAKYPVPGSVMLIDAYLGTSSSVAQPKTLCAAVSKNGEGVDNPTAHLQCYKIKDATKLATGIQEVVLDQFGSHAIELKKAMTLCNPAEINGVALVGSINHYKCYKIKPTGKSEVFVALTDQFETVTAQRLAPKSYCTPVLKDGSPVPEPGAAMLCYKLKQPTTKRAATMSDQFAPSSITMNLSAAKTLCVPVTFPTPTT